MGVDIAEIRFSGEEENDSADRREGAVAPRLALGGLEETVDSFKKTIGLTGLCPRDDAVEMGADHLGDLLH